MSGYIVSQHYFDDDLGEVAVRVLSTARRFTARIRDGIVHVTIPDKVSEAEYRVLLESMKPRLAAALQRPLSPYHDGYRFETTDWSFELRRSDSVAPLQIRSESDANNHMTFLYGSGIDFADPAHARFMSNCISSRARDFMLDHIVDKAWQTAARLGCRPAQIVVSRGLRVLGHCSSRKAVALSEKIAFLPEDLRMYIITHELAHLTQMNHSAAFYALWERYMGCPSGPLKARLKKFRWPVI